jgi:hypothetical protein
MCDSFKKELLLGTHAFGTGTGVIAHTASTADSFKAALYYSTATINKSTTVYTTTGEVANVDSPNANYTAGGIAVTAFADPTITTPVAFTTPGGNLVWSNVTISSTSFDAVLVYNSSQGNKAVSVHTFGSQTITAGTLTLTMPTNNSTSALLRLA